MAIHAFLIHCITNLHVGSGDANYGIIDKLVQRDTVTRYPTIHASSLKGSIREYFEKAWGKRDPRIAEIFGSEDDSDTAQSGNCNFLNADLLALPVRCSHKQFALTFCKTSIASINEKTKLLKNGNVLNTIVEEDKLYTNDKINSTQYLEDCNVTTNLISPILAQSVHNFTALQNQFAVVKDESFDQFVHDLPVIARNKLGKNKNLWYEEVVPHQTIFLTFIIENSINWATMKEEILNGVIQIGANSSVGYGLCKFYEVAF